MNINPFYCFTRPASINKRRVFMLLTLLLLSAVNAFAAENHSFTFRSGDKLLITADRYTPLPPKTAPLIVLFHQAGSSRGEYIDIAPRLNKLGFNCIAVDLRSGEYSTGIDNETAIRASNAGMATHYVDALPDVIAALKYARKNYPKSKITAWGSSYSAALVLKVAGDYPELIDAVIAFSPGEYFAHLGKSKTWIKDSAIKIKAPVFITSSKDEANSWKAIFDSIPSSNKTGFIPVTAGRHGSRALWKKTKDSEAYWEAVSQFLLSNKPTALP